MGHRDWRELQQMASQRDAPAMAKLVRSSGLSALQRVKGELPVPIFQIVNVLNIALTQSDDTNVVGECWPSDGRIVVGAHLSPADKHFVMAHQLGHVLFDRGGVSGPHNYDANATDPIELRANEFAAHLLMPMEFLEHHAEKNPDAARLADIFAVPVKAVTWHILRYYG